MRVLIPLALALLATGCATGYHKSGFTGGYWEKSGPGELIEVGFSGNGYIKEERVGDYLMYRCAEVARQHGGKYFTIYHSIYEAIADRPLPDASTTALGGKPYGKVFMLLQDSRVPAALAVDEVLVKYDPAVKRKAGGAAAQQAEGAQ